MVPLSLVLTDDRQGLTQLGFEPRLCQLHSVLTQHAAHHLLASSWLAVDASNALFYFGTSLLE